VHSALIARQHHREDIVPAARSRTENWRRSLDHIHERNGALEITLPRYIEGGADGGSPNLIWRVRILSLNDQELVVEEPSALGRTIEIAEGVELVGIIAVGQNRWMFRTRNLGRTKTPINAYRIVSGLRLAMPTDVERCQRRNFYRVSTIGLSLPTIECFTLLDPASAEVAEAANRVAILDASDQVTASNKPATAQPFVMPQVGPGFRGQLMNIGGGGVGMLLEPSVSGALDAHRLLWLRIDLRPHIPLPLCVTARVKHTHIDSSQRVYAGLAFEFGGHAQHQKFVVDQLCRYVALVQRDQLRHVDPGAGLD